MLQNEKILDLVGRRNLLGQLVAPEAVSSLNEQFIVPPFSILDGRAGYWTQRKAAWNKLPFDSGKGRPANLLKFSSQLIAEFGNEKNNGTGIFDPVLCELMYTWLCPKNGLVIDPFSGGSVRGVVATYLGYRYKGCDLRKEQIDENRKQAAALGLKPEYFCSDSRRFAAAVKCKDGNFMFSSPPYYNREHHCDLPTDLNNSTSYELYIKGYREVIASAVSCLEMDSFAAFEVADSRAKNGLVLNMVGATIEAFELAGMHLYNHIIHIKPVMTGHVRAPRMFNASRKFCPLHENILVFVKGDWKKAVAKLK